MTQQNASPAARALPSASLVLAALLVLCGCGSSAQSATQAAATSKTCQQVGAVLSDGPDPDADPVGYAEAQILPLRQVAAPDKALKNAIRALADAYQRFFASSGTSDAAKEAVAVASKKINSFCPGAAS